MAAGNMAAGINHDHQRRADGQRRKTADAGVNDDHADGENEQKHADEFNEIFFHRLAEVSRLVSGKENHIGEFLARTNSLAAFKPAAGSVSGF